jgi:Family of unknown function (DUF6502)
MRSHMSTPKRSRQTEVSRRPALGVVPDADILLDVADVLLRAGITPAHLSALMRPAFAQAAASRARLKNGRVNYSRVAAKTGLTRSEVRKLLKKPSDVRPAPAPIDRVLEGWRTDRKFLDREGKPKRLTLIGKRNTFARLGRKYARDIPARALITELEAEGLASLDPSGVSIGTEKRGSGLLASASFRKAVRKLLKQARQQFMVTSANRRYKKLSY